MKWPVVKSGKNQTQVLTPFPPPFGIPGKRDFYISTAATAIQSLPRSKLNKSRHTHIATGRFAKPSNSVPLSAKTHVFA